MIFGILRSEFRLGQIGLAVVEHKTVAQSPVHADNTKHGDKHYDMLKGASLPLTIIEKISYQSFHLRLTQ